MSTAFRAQRRFERGISLVEVMVGLVIGLIATLVVMQVFQLSEGARRSTVGGDDAQMAGTLTLSALQRELRQAGYGSSAFPLLGCTITLPGGWTLPAVAPVTINPPAAVVPAGDANTDTLLVMYGNGGGSPEGDLVAAQSPQSVYSVATPTSFAVGDFVVAAQEWMTATGGGPRPVATPCALTLEPVLAVTSPSPPTVTVGLGVAAMVNGTLFNFGANPRFIAYAVRGGNLTMCDYRANDCRGGVNNPAVWTPIGQGIVSLRAVYGRDNTAPMDGSVDQYVRATPATQCGWARVSALQLVVVSRSGEFDRTLGTTVPAIAEPEWRASDVAAINVRALPDWQNYRYKTFETTVPVKNIAWQGAQAGC
ncbi:MAG: PilW family protein [Proteobacteria bacterium]|nr:PilW family protein [Pseudomonadota bacterium]